MLSRKKKKMYNNYISIFCLLIVLFACGSDNEQVTFYDTGEIKSKRLSMGDSSTVTSFYKNGNIKSQFATYNLKLSRIEYYNEKGGLLFESKHRKGEFEINSKTLSSDSIAYFLNLKSPEFQDLSFKEGVENELEENFEDFFFSMNNSQGDGIAISMTSGTELKGILFDLYFKMITDSTASIHGRHVYVDTKL